MMQNNNTLSGFHIKSKKGEVLKLYPKQYNWHIPKHLRDVNLQPGDIVAVGETMAPVLITKVFREELEETGRQYKTIVKLVEKAPQLKKEKERA